MHAPQHGRSPMNLGTTLTDLFTRHINPTLQDTSIAAIQNLGRQDIQNTFQRVETGPQSRFQRSFMETRLGDRVHSDRLSDAMGAYATPQQRDRESTIPRADTTGEHTTHIGGGEGGGGSEMKEPHPEAVKPPPGNSKGA
mmetsp:Transcript_8656/g.13390  ORF Transcript_8656/g.13390 Transcript_8656/m.13390 type:complete len:140 (-) Transcript_8656:291-710(-)